MSKEQSKTLIITQLAMTVAALISGGYVIFLASGLFPLPGIKYILMSPYLSLIIAIVMINVKTRWVVLKINTVFAMIMAIINIYMGLAIFLTGACTQIVATLTGSSKFQVQITASFYSSFTVGIALLVSKLFIGGAVFEKISPIWIASAVLLAFVLGAIGSIFGTHIAHKIKKALGSRGV
ncbi:MAG: hypothetical protein H7X94_11880 [Vallitaleaceae bacterium]|nr:hypothetical protein [Vallitaleaceae bacterium]